MRIITIEGNKEEKRKEKQLVDAIEQLISDNKKFYNISVNYIIARYE